MGAEDAVCGWSAGRAVFHPFPARVHDTLKAALTRAGWHNRGSIDSRYRQTILCACGYNHRTPAGHSRSSNTPNPRAQTIARRWDLRPNRTGYEWCFYRRAWLLVPGVTPTGGKRLDPRRLGKARDRSPGENLSIDEAGPRSVVPREAKLDKGVHRRESGAC